MLGGRKKEKKGNNYKIVFMYLFNQAFCQGQDATQCQFLTRIQLEMKSDFLFLFLFSPRLIGVLNLNRPVYSVIH